MWYKAVGTMEKTDPDVNLNDTYSYPNITRGFKLIVFPCFRSYMNFKSDLRSFQ